MRAYVINSVNQTVSAVDANISAPSMGIDDNTRQDDYGLKSVLGGISEYDLELIPGAEGHHLVVDPNKRYDLDGPTFVLNSDPTCAYGGHAIILGVDNDGFHSDVQLTLEQARALVRFVTEEEHARFF